MLLSDGSRKYVYGLGLAYTVDSSGALQVYHADGLGSVRAITDASGVVVQTLQTDAFGVVSQSQGSVNQPFGFTGQQVDPSGLVYLRARFYDPTSGRFMSRDPFAGALASPLSLHRYTYVENSPLSATDPSGLASGSICACGNVGTITSGGGSKVKDDGSGQHLACDSPNGQNSHELMNVVYTPPILQAVVHSTIATAQATLVRSGVVSMTSIPSGGDRGDWKRGAPVLGTNITMTPNGAAHLLRRHYFTDLAAFAGKSKFYLGENPFNFALPWYRQGSQSASS